MTTSDQPSTQQPCVKVPGPQAVASGPARAVDTIRGAHRVRSAVVALAVAGSAVLGVSVAPAGAANTCTADYCVVDSGTPTPLGPITVSVSAANVVTVTLTPNTPNIEVFGLPFTFPPSPAHPPVPVHPPAPIFPGYARTSITTSAGTINVDTIIFPPGEANLTNVAIISIYPPSPIRVRTTGNTVVFTPILTPAPK